MKLAFDADIEAAPAGAGGRGGDGNGSDGILMTPQLQMAIKLLQISRMELVEQVREELNDREVFMKDQEVPNETETEVGK